MDIIGWLQSIARDASTRPGFQPQLLYVMTSVLLPVLIGLAVGFSLRLIERIFGIELGKGAH